MSDQADCGNIKTTSSSKATLARVGFGTSGLHGGWASRKHSLHLLEVAYDEGLRYFDTAPMYGLGYAESVLGDFVRSRRPEAVIATKFGIPGPSPRQRALLELARTVAKPVADAFPGAKQVMLRLLAARATNSKPISQQGQRVVDESNGTSRFTPAALFASVDASLRTLRIGQIPVLIMHEARADDLSEELLDALAQLKKAGKIERWGLGSPRRTIEKCMTVLTRCPDVVQFEWSTAAEAAPSWPGTTTILHGAVRAAASSPWAQNPDTLRVASIRAGVDLCESGRLASVALSMALSANTGSRVIFTSRSAKHIAEVCRFLRQPETETAGASLLEWLGK